MVSDWNSLQACNVGNSIQFKRADPEEYVDAYFCKNTYLMCYSNMIHPVPHKSRWPDVEHHVVAPPPVKRGAGRPKKIRRREKGEAVPSTERTTQGSYRCHLCKNFGHNQRSCPQRLGSGLSSS